MIDVREFPSEIPRLHTSVDDATSLHQIEDESIDSMSALCSIEHFGLGRYGDPIDPEACFKCYSGLCLLELSCRTEKGIEYNADIHAYDNDGHNGEYRYGLFHFIK